MMEDKLRIDQKLNIPTSNVPILGQLPLPQFQPSDDLIGLAARRPVICPYCLASGIITTMIPVKSVLNIDKYLSPLIEHFIDLESYCFICCHVATFHVPITHKHYNHIYALRSDNNLVPSEVYVIPLKDKAMKQLESIKNQVPLGSEYGRPRGTGG